MYCFRITCLIILLTFCLVESEDSVHKEIISTIKPLETNRSCLVPEIQNGYMVSGNKKLAVSQYVSHKTEVDLTCDKTHEITSRLERHLQSMKTVCIEGNWLILMKCVPARCFKKVFDKNFLQTQGLELIRGMPFEARNGSRFVVQCKNGYGQTNHEEAITCAYGKWLYPNKAINCTRSSSTLDGLYEDLGPTVSTHRLTNSLVSETSKFSLATTINSFINGNSKESVELTTQYGNLFRTDKSLQEYTECVFNFDNKNLVVYKNGNIVAGDKITISVGEELTFHCIEIGKYLFSGDKKLVCTKRKWLGKMPNCTYLRRWNKYSAPEITVENPYSPVISPLGNLKILEGSNVTFMCLWLKRFGVPKWEVMENITHFDNAYQESRTFGLKLKIIKLRKEQAGLYTCTSPYMKANSVFIDVIGENEELINSTEATIKASSLSTTASWRRFSRRLPTLVTEEKIKATENEFKLTTEINYFTAEDSDESTSAEEITLEEYPFTTDIPLQETTECVFNFNNKKLVVYKDGKIVSGDKITVEIGDELTFHCIQFGTYLFSGDNKLICTKRNWLGKMPNCTYLRRWNTYSAPVIQLVNPDSAARNPLGNLKILEGSNVTLKCFWLNSYGDPMWEFRENNILFDNAYQESKGTELELHVTKIRKDQSGLYSCRSPYKKANSVIIDVIGEIEEPTNTTDRITFLESTTRVSEMPTSISTRYWSRFSTRFPKWVTEIHFKSTTESRNNSLCMSQAYKYLDIFTNGKQITEKVNHFLNGTYLTFRCQSSLLFKFEGTSKIHCFNGRWSNPWPKCIPTAENSKFYPPPVRVLANEVLVRLDNGEIVIGNHRDVIYFVCSFTIEKPRILLNGIDFEELGREIEYSEEFGYVVRIMAPQSPRKWTFECQIPRNPHLSNSVTVRTGGLCATPAGRYLNNLRAQIHPADQQTVHAEGDVVRLSCDSLTAKVRRSYVLPDSLVCSARGVWTNGEGVIFC